MHIHLNHMFCFDSNWGGNFDSRYLVALDTLRKVDQEDCQRLLVKKSVFDQTRWNQSEAYYQGLNWTPEQIENQRGFYQKSFKMFKPEVLKWLEENVADVRNRNQPKGWCVGSENYQMMGGHAVSIWFVRRRDALLFIETFSSHKKPTTYFDYFRGIRKELDLKKNKLILVDEFSEEILRFVSDK